MADYLLTKGDGLATRNGGLVVGQCAPCCGGFCGTQCCGGTDPDACGWERISCVGTTTQCTYAIKWRGQISGTWAASESARPGFAGGAGLATSFSVPFSIPFDVNITRVTTGTTGCFQEVATGEQQIMVPGPFVGGAAGTMEPVYVVADFRTGFGMPAAPTPRFGLGTFGRITSGFVPTIRANLMTYASVECHSRVASTGAIFQRYWKYQACALRRPATIGAPHAGAIMEWLGARNVQPTNSPQTAPITQTYSLATIAPTIIGTNCGKGFVASAGSSWSAALVADPSVTSGGTLTVTATVEIDYGLCCPGDSGPEGPDLSDVHDAMMRGAYGKPCQGCG
jgi:hypothetical protein